VGPECSHEIIGIRPGERIHEVLVPVDVAPLALEFDDFFVIEPQFHEQWGLTLPRTYAGQIGRGVAEEYRSDTNSQWLQPRELRKLIDE
jgi:UDP-N-acetylglucosamine 4,6-dehydratase